MDCGDVPSVRVHLTEPNGRFGTLQAATCRGGFQRRGTVRNVC